MGVSTRPKKGKMVNYQLNAMVKTEEQLGEEQKIFVKKCIKLAVKDKRIIEAFRKIPRHLFVPDEYRSESYLDVPLLIGHGQTISQPSLVALMIEKLKLKGGGKVLEIGTGSGFQTAILAKLAKEIYSIETIEDLAKKAKEVLVRFGCDNVTIIIGDGSKGLPEKQPFDGIIVSAVADSVPQELMDQLKEGGRLVIPVKESVFGQMLKVGLKRKGVVVFEDIEPVTFVPLIEEKELKSNPEGS